MTPIVYIYRIILFELCYIFVLCLRRKTLNDRKIMFCETLGFVRISNESHPLDQGFQFANSRGISSKGFNNNNSRGSSGEERPASKRLNYDADGVYFCYTIEQHTL